MVKTKFKKAVSLMLAAVMSLTAFMGIGATTAFAAVGEKADVYLVDYPRSGDTNNNGEWGHGIMRKTRPWPYEELAHIPFIVRGPGIAPEHQAEIFAEFYQVGNAAREQGKGLGLGLSIVDAVCRLYGLRVGYSYINRCHCFSVHFRI